MSTASPSAPWSEPWNGLASPELGKALESLARPRTLQDGELLYARGEPGRHLYGVASGVIRVVSLTADGQEGLLGLYGPGTWFGEVSLFDDRPRPVSTYAEGETVVWVLGNEQLQSVLDSNPIWYRDFARVLCNKLRLALTHIHATQAPVSQRLSARLLDLGQAYGLGDSRRQVTISVSQEDLARMLGLTRQTINKELKTMERRGWLSLGRGRICVRDAEALKLQAQALSDD